MKTVDTIRESPPFAVGMARDPVNGHFVGTYYLRGKREEIDLTAILGIGIDDRLAEGDPLQLSINLDRVGGWRYTLYQAWIEARQRLDILEREYKGWEAGAYLGHEKVAQDEKAIAVAAKTRSVSEQVTRASIEARMIVGCRKEWDDWHRRIEDARLVERSMEALYRCVDRRGEELRTIIGNLGYLARRP